MSTIQHIVCVICCASFTTKGNLKLHENSIHKNIKFDCKDCGKTFKQKGHLTRHINYVHNEIRYKCDQCDKEYTCASNRNTHV